MVLSIWVTDSCNMCCEYCYEGRKTGKIMPVNYIESIVKFIRKVLPYSESDDLYVKFFGGEPLLNEGFIQAFIETIESNLKKDLKHVRYSITTNGTMLNKDSVDYFERKKVECSISLDGFPEVNNRHRKLKSGGNAWEAVNQNLDYIFKSNLKVAARMTYTSETVSFVSDSVKFLAERGFTTIILIPDFFDTKWTDEKFEQLTKQYYEVKKYGRYHPEVDICTGNVSYNPYKGYYGCGGGKNTFSIDVNGDIYPCTYAVEFEKFKLGDIFHWNDYKIVDYKTDHEQRKDCKGCKYFQICISGRCIFLNYKATGQFYKPGACFCEYQKLEYKYLGI